MESRLNMMEEVGLNKNNAVTMLSWLNLSVTLIKVKVKSIILFPQVSFLQALSGSYNLLSSTSSVTGDITELVKVIYSKARRIKVTVWGSAVAITLSPFHVYVQQITLST